MQDHAECSVNKREQNIINECMIATSTLESSKLKLHIRFDPTNLSDILVHIISTCS